ncbi:MAG TPA: ABC transporter permease [Opitutaceae bacterium]
MNPLRPLFALLHRKKVDADMAEEMRLHLEQRTAENIAAGLSPDEARYAALRRFGGMEQAKERAREQRAGLWLDRLGQDLRLAGRMLRKNPGFTIVAILTLALGIGANTAMFSLVNALLLRALPVSDPSRLVQLQSRNGDESFSYVAYERFREETKTLQDLAILQRSYDSRALIATGLGRTQAESVRGQAVGGNTFQVLGLPATLGRSLLAEDSHPDNPQPVAVLSHACWQRQFGSDPSVVGKAVQLDGVMLTIVGVMPEGFSGFHLGVPIDVWWPIELYPQLEKNPSTGNRLKAVGWEWALLVGRLAPGATREAAAAELQTIFLRQRSDIAAKSTNMTEKERRDYLTRAIEVVPGGAGFTSLRKRLAQPITILSLVVGAVLLIACANVAGLLLARGAARQRELAVRVALGAGRGRIVQQLVTESLLLALLGGAAGLVFAQVGTVLLKRYLLSHPHGLIDMSLDLRMLGFALIVSTLTGLLFGLVPALRLSREAALQVTSKAAVGGTRSRLNQGLVVAQIALSVVLLAGAGLFVRSLQKLKETDLGFRSDNVVRFVLEFGSGFNGRQRAVVHKQVLEKIEALPGVRSATVSGSGLLGGDGFGIRFAVEGHTHKPEDDTRALVVVAGPRFFETLGIPLRAGRDFSARDEQPVPPTGPTYPRVVVVGETFARRFFGDANPIGRTVRFGQNPQQPPLEIIGVAKDVKYRSLREPAQLALYVPYFGGVMNTPMVVQAATQGDPRALESNLRALVQGIDSQVVVSDLGTMQDLVDHSLVQERMVANFGGFFGLFALTLACLGLYGVLSYGVVQRTREIGVRMALGAKARDVLSLVVSQGLKLALLGTVVGVGVALATTHLATKLLWGVTPADPLTFIGAAMLLLTVATLASWLPARRAAKVDPMVALHAE